MTFYLLWKPHSRHEPRTIRWRSCSLQRNENETKEDLRGSRRMSDERTLREQARRALKAGKLPNRRPNQTWGGPGVGHPCSICRSPITRDELELEVEFAPTDVDTGPRTHHVHVRCFAAWESERKSRAPRTAVEHPSEASSAASES